MRRRAPCSCAKQRRAAHCIVSVNRKSVAARMDLNDVICVSSRTVVVPTGGRRACAYGAMCIAPEVAFRPVVATIVMCSPNCTRRLTSRSRRSTGLEEDGQNLGRPFVAGRGRPVGDAADPQARAGHRPGTAPTRIQPPARRPRGNTGSACFAGGLGVLQQDLRIHRHDVGCHLARRHERRGVEHVFDNADLLG